MGHPTLNQVRFELARREGESKKGKGPERGRFHSHCIDWYAQFLIASPSFSTPSREITAGSNLFRSVRDSNLYNIISDPPIARSLMICKTLMGLRTGRRPFPFESLRDGLFAGG
jgi:hypothetical protein